MIGEFSIADFIIADLESVSSDAAVVTLYYSNVGYTTGSTETLADTHFESRLISPITWRRSAVSSRFGGKAAFTAGEIELDNVDGMLNDVVKNYAIDGREVIVKVGTDGLNYDQFLTLFGGTADGWQTTKDGKARINPRGFAYKFQQDLQGNKYAGTGGSEGGANIEGKPKPLAFGGIIYNAQPVLLDSSVWTYQVHDGEINSIQDVFDRGVALTYDGNDYADYSTLAAASVASGQYAICTAEGYFKLGAAPDGIVTIDFEGGVYDSYITRPSDILKEIAITYGNLDLANLRQGSFTNLKTDVDYPIAFYTGLNNLSIGAVFNAICASIEAYWGDTRDGQLQVNQVKKPTGSSFWLSFDEGDIYVNTFEWLRLPSAVQPSVKRATVGYEQSWVVQNSDLAGAITDARRERVGQSYRYVTDTNADAALVNLEAKSLTVNAFFSTEAGALSHVSYLLDLYSQQTQFCRVTVSHKGFLVNMGDKINLSIDRLNVHKIFTVVGISLNAQRKQVELTLVG